MPKLPEHHTQKSTRIAGQELLANRAIVLFADGDRNNEISAFYAIDSAQIDGVTLQSVSKGDAVTVVEDGEVAIEFTGSTVGLFAGSNLCVGADGRVRPNTGGGQEVVKAMQAPTADGDVIVCKILRNAGVLADTSGGG